MIEVKKLQMLFEFGIPIQILARECRCSPSSIRNYIAGTALPSGSKQIAIKDGLKHFTDMIIAITKE